MLTVPTKVSVHVILSEAKDLTFRKTPAKSRSFASLRMTQQSVLPHNRLLSVASMLSTFTAKYTEVESGYMGQLVEWPQVVTEGKTLEECREMLQDALWEMIQAHRDLGKEIPVGV